MDVITTVNLLLKLTDTVASKLPNEHQRRVKQYMKVKREYLYESAQSYPERDDNLIDNLRDELLVAIEGVSSAVPKEDV